jgi:hypothetical protein
MARLPIPGSDNGAWGGVLNDFLSQSHNGNGDLKPNVIDTVNLKDGSVTVPKLTTVNSPSTNAVLSYNTNGDLAWAAPSSDPPLGGDLSGTASNAQIAASVIGATELANNAVTTNKIANGSITAAKLAPGIQTTSDAGLRSLFIFYSPPNIINGRFSDDYAAGIVSRHGDAIFGTGLQDPVNTYHASTLAIIQKVAALGTNTVIWGYIDIGVTSSNYSLSALQTQIDQWIAMGVGGIFCDLVGYDYGVSRARQNSVINYIHGKGVGAMLNVWNIDDLLAPTIDITYNPGGTPTTANNTDVLLLESWIVNSDAYTSPYYATFSDIKTRGDKAISYRTSMGIRVYATNIYSHSNHTLGELKYMHDYTNAFARVWRFDGSGLAASNFGSTGVDLGVATPLYSALRPTPLRPTTPYSLNGPWTQVDATDIGVSVTYDPGNTNYTWSQD